METNTVQINKTETFSYTVGKSESEADDQNQGQNECDMLRDALAHAVQEQAYIELEMQNLIIAHQEKLASMVEVRNQDTGKKLMDIIINAMDMMNHFNDEGAYRLLESAKLEHGEQYGYVEVDPLSDEALLLG